MSRGNSEHLRRSGAKGREAGNALVGILAAVGIFGIISVAMSTLIADVWKAQNSAKSLAEANNFHEEVRTHLSNRQACLNTFGGPSRDYRIPHPKSFDINDVKNGENPAATPAPTVTTRYVKNTALGSGAIEIASMRIVYPSPLNSPSDPDEALFLLSYRPKGQVLGPDILKAREIVLAVKIDAGGVMTECRPKAKMSDGIWQRLATDPSKIYYNEGNVGIGTTTPLSALHLLSATTDTTALLTENTSSGSRWALQNNGTSWTPSGRAGSFELKNVNTGDIPIAVNQAGNVGLGTLTPQAKLDVAGAVKTSDSTLSCTAANVGTMRYNPTTDSLEFCKNNLGVPSWKPAGGGNLECITVQSYGAHDYVVATCPATHKLTGGSSYNGTDGHWGAQVDTAAGTVTGRGSTGNYPFAICCRIQ